MKKTRRSKPEVSVIMPVYNGAEFLVESIESILNQTYQNFEFIIVNDGSTDTSNKIIKHYQKLHPKIIRTINLPQRNGAYNAINKGLLIAKGDFIALMDSDDISDPRRFEKQIEFLGKHKDVIILGTYAKLIDTSGEVIGEKVFPSSHGEIYKKFIEVHPLVHPTCMIRRSIIGNRKRLYYCKYGTSDDYYTFFTLLEKGKIANFPEYLLSYRIHSHNSSLQKVKQKFFTSLIIRLKAIFNLGYKPHPAGIIIMLLQTIAVTILPEKTILYLYFHLKKDYSISNFLNIVKKQIVLHLGRLQRQAISLTDLF